MTPDARAYSMMVEHDLAVPMIEQIHQIMDALLDYDLIMSITIPALLDGSEHWISYNPPRGEYRGRSFYVQTQHSVNARNFPEYRIFENLLK